MKKNILPCILLCAAVLTSCGMSEEAAETSFTTVSESVSETTKTETRTETSDETEASESSETVPAETESAENFDKVKDRIIFSDGENTLTAGQYIDALESCEEFDVNQNDILSLEIQIMDMDENGIPEIMLCFSKFMVSTYSRSKLFTVSAEGKAKAVPILNDDICDRIENYLIGGNPSPYEKDGKTVWISNFRSFGIVGGESGEYEIKYDGSGIDGEIIDLCSYFEYWQNDENGEEDMARDDYYYIFGEEVTAEEFERRKQEFFDSLQPSDALYVQYTMGEKSEITENIAEALEKYLDMREEADKSA